MSTLPARWRQQEMGKSTPLSSMATNGANFIDVLGGGTAYGVLGLPAIVNVTNSEASTYWSSMRRRTTIPSLSPPPCRHGPLTVDGGAGDDTIFGSQGNDRLLGGDGDDFVFGDQRQRHGLPRRR